MTDITRAEVCVTAIADLFRGDGEITAGLTRRPEDARGSLDGNHIGDAYRQLAMGHWTPLTSAIADCI